MSAIEECEIAAPTVAMVVRPDGQIEDLRGPDHWCGFLAAQLIGTYLQDLLHPDDVVDLAMGVSAIPAARSSETVRVVAFDGRLHSMRITRQASVGGLTCDALFEPAVVNSA